MPLNVMMPGVDGCEVCRRLRADPATAGIPVVFVAALSGSDDRVKGSRRAATASL